MTVLFLMLTLIIDHFIISYTIEEFASYNFNYLYGLASCHTLSYMNLASCYTLQITLCDFYVFIL